MEQPSLAEGHDYSYRPGYVTADVRGSKGQYHQYRVSTTDLCAWFCWFVAEVKKIGNNINGGIWGNFLYAKKYGFHNARWRSVVSIATDAVHEKCPRYITDKYRCIKF